MFANLWRRLRSRKPAKIQRPSVKFRVDALEDRTVPAVTATYSAGLLTFTGDGANDKVVLEATSNPTTVVYDAGGGGLGGVTQSGVNQVIFNGFGGDDQLLISNASPKIFVPSLGITFNAGNDAGDNIRLVGGSTSTFSTGSYNAAGNDGSIVHTTTAGTINVTFTGVPSVVDTTVTGGAFTTSTASGTESVNIAPNGSVGPITTITQGPVFIDGGDRDDVGHGSFNGVANVNGWKFIEQAVQFARNGSFNTGTTKDVLVLGTTAGSQARNAIVSALTVLGYSADFVSGAAISTVDFRLYKAIYVPSTNTQTSGGISAGDVGLLNARRLDVGALAGISTYVKSGGGIVALTEAGLTAGVGYGWLQLPDPFVITESFTGGSTTIMVQTPALAAAGFSITDAELSGGTPVHNRFTGPEGSLDEYGNPTFNGLKVLVKNNVSTHYIVLGQGAINTSYGDAALSTRITGSTMNTLVLGNKGSLPVNTLGGDDTITVDGSAASLLTLAGPLTINAGGQPGDTVTINSQFAGAITGNVTNAAGNLGVAFGTANIIVTPTISSLTFLSKGGDVVNLNSYPSPFALPNLGFDNVSGTSSTAFLNASNIIEDATAITVSGNAIFDVQAASDTIAALNGNGFVTNSVAGSPVLTVGGANGSGNFAGVLANAAGTLNLVKIGNGTQVLSGSSPNTYGGTTLVHDGTLSLDKTDNITAIPTGAVTIGNGVGGAASAILRVDSDEQIGNAVAVSLGGSDGQLFVTSGNDETIVPINPNFQGGDVRVGGTLIVSATYQQGTAVGVGGGTTTLAGGTLRAVSTGLGVVDILAGTLQGTGTVVAQMVNNHAFIDPGIGSTSAGQIEIQGNLEIKSTGAVNLHIGGTADNTSDEINVTLNAGITPAPINVTNGTAWFRGTLNTGRIGAYVPTNLDFYDVMTFATRMLDDLATFHLRLPSDFATKNLGPDGAGFRYDPRFLSATNQLNAESYNSSTFGLLGNPPPSVGLAKKLRLTALSGTATDVTATTAVTRGGFTTNSTIRHQYQYLTIKNNGAAISGPIYIEFTVLTAGLKVYNRAGFTQSSGLTKEYLVVSPTGLATGASVQVQVDWLNPNIVPFSYTTKVLAGGLP